MKNLLLSMLASVTFLEASAFAMEDDRDRGSIVPHFSKAEVDAQPESHIIPPTGYCAMRLQPSDEFVGSGQKVLVTPGDSKDDNVRVTFYTEKLSEEEASKPSWYPQGTIAIVPLYNYTRIDISGQYLGQNRQGTLCLDDCFFYATEGASYTIKADYKGQLEVRKKVTGHVPNNQFEIEEVVFIEDPEDYIDGKSSARCNLWIMYDFCMDLNFSRNLGLPQADGYDFGRQTNLSRPHSCPDEKLRRITSDGYSGILTGFPRFEDKHLYAILANMGSGAWESYADCSLTDKGDLYSLLPASLRFMLSYKNKLYLDQQ